MVEKKESFIRKYGVEISIIITLLGLTGFNFNIVSWYQNLTYDSKIYVMFLLNLIITLYFFSQLKK